MNNSEFKENIEQIDKSFMETYGVVRGLVREALDAIADGIKDKAEDVAFLAGDVAEFSVEAAKSIRGLITGAFDMMKEAVGNLKPVMQHRDKETTLTLMETLKISVCGENLLKDAGCSDNLNKEISAFAEGCPQLGKDFATSAISLKELIEKTFDTWKYGKDSPDKRDLADWLSTDSVLDKISKIMSDLQEQDTLKIAPLIKLQKLLTAKDPSRSQDADGGYIKNNPIKPGKPIAEYTGLELRMIKAQLTILRMSIDKDIKEGRALKGSIENLETRISCFLDNRSYSLEDFISQTVKNDKLEGYPAVIQYIIQRAKGTLTPEVLDSVIYAYESENHKSEFVDYKDTGYQLIPIYEKICLHICDDELSFCRALKSVLEKEYGKDFELKIFKEPQTNQKKEKPDYSKE